MDEKYSSTQNFKLYPRCSNPTKREGEVYNCVDPRNICRSLPTFMYDWGKDAGTLSLPADVGFEVDEERDVYIVMQVRAGGTLRPKNGPILEF